MLTDISIKNFAIIDTLQVTFGSGLNVLTGETGAGKSIIIDAVNLLLGGRSSADLVRSGAEEATVEAIFHIGSQQNLHEVITGYGIECEDELLVKRVITRSGKNRIYLNGGLATLSMLSDISARLVNIYGQHESQTLLKVENHVELLDGCTSLKPLATAFGDLFRKHSSAVQELRKVETGERDLERRIDLLSYQMEEIGKAALSPGEDEDLEQELKLLLNAEKLLSRSSSAYDLLYGGDATILGTLRTAQSAVEDIETIDPSLRPTVEALSSAYLVLEDAALELRDYVARIELDPARIDAVQERLELLRKLKKKYGYSIEDVLIYQHSVAAELEFLRNRSESRETLELSCSRLKSELDEKGKELGDLRMAGAIKLEASLGEELHQLAMKHAIFKVRFEKLAEPRDSGYEKVEFLFSPNPGEPPRPLARIASGGELSRLMLALKQLHPESDVPTLVFDEVDSGIGGSVSALVGKKLKKVARNQQVLCITHLPQVAVFADHHFQVSKRMEEGRTCTELSHLDADGRVQEIARMLGGVTITDKTRDHAREMLEKTLDC